MLVGPANVPHSSPSPTNPLLNIGDIAATTPHRRRRETPGRNYASGPSGPDPRYRTHLIRTDNPGPDRLQPGDVIIRISDDGTRRNPPAVVDAAPNRVSHTRHAVAYRLYARTDLGPITMADAARALTEHGHPTPRLHHNHRIISPSLRADLLRLWKL